MTRLVRALGPSAALCWALGAVYVVLVYRTAWLSDDAFITLRTVSNLLDGYGLRWNIAERVQTFTHPLWLLWLTGAHAISGEPFYSTLYVSWLVSCAAVAVLFFGTRGGALERALSLGLLIFSKAFVEYSSSGLENPLTHLWLACFVVAYLRRDPRGSLVPISAILGLAILTRLDTGLLYVPAWLFCLRERSWRERAGSAFVAGLPIAAWLAFSLVYYGFFWPNTAYAKLGVGEIAGLHRLSEALWYFATSLFSDPLTLGGWIAIVKITMHGVDVGDVWLIDRASRTVLITDSVFLTRRRANDEAFWKPFEAFYSWAWGVADRVAIPSYQPAMWQSLPSFQASLRRALEHDFDHAGSCHGAWHVLENDARAELGRELAWLLELSPLQGLGYLGGFVRRHPGIFMRLVREQIAARFG